MKYKDYYETLGLPRTATQDEIKTAYRKLARKHHPDVNKQVGAEERFKEVAEAYQVLKDPEKRAAYDRMGSNWQNGQDFQPPPDWNEGYEFHGRGTHANADADLSDFFAEMFGQAAAGAHGRQRDIHAAGEDHHAKVVIALEDAYRGAQRTISLKMPAVDAQGHLTLQVRTLNVSIPKGVMAGQRLRLAGQGGAGLGQGPAGDLYLEIAFQEHSRFRVDGRDVSVDLPVAPWEVALGAQVTVPTPDSSADMTIPPGSTSGRRLRLKGKGIPGNPAGDLYVILNIVLPPADSDSAKTAYEAMRQAFNFNPRAHFYG
jgi:curved DNA-binding protein